jgi:hypothetical protein
MKGWWITEEHVREQIRNCDEIMGEKLGEGSAR